MFSFPAGPYLVTGASGGIGGATVRRLREAGCTVHAGGRDAAKITALCEETGALPLLFDLVDEHSVETALGGTPWVGVVNCGGDGGEIASPQDTDTSVFDRVMAVNARGTLLVTKFAAREMIAAGRGGAIVNVSSQASLVALTGHISYASSKGAVDAMTRVSALELGPHGIRVNAVNPTVVMTPMSAWYWDKPDTGGKLLDAMPLGRYATEDEIAGPIAFLLSDAARMVSGVTLPVDGGFTAV